MSGVETIKNPCDSTQNSPASWCKKSDSKDAVVPSADFLLEAEKRGSPPKSEKAAAFWRVGGAGRGVQPFLREDSGESNAKNDENLADSLLRQNDSYNLDSRDLDCFGDKSPRNDEIDSKYKHTKGAK